MADDIQTLEEELNDLFAEVDRVLKALATLSGRDKDDVCFSSSFVLCTCLCFTHVDTRQQLDYCRNRTDRIKRGLHRTQMQYWDSTLTGMCTNKQ